MTTRDLLFEIGTEELPSSPLNKALKQLDGLVKERFARERINYRDYTIFSTPRRIAFLMRGVAETQESSVLEYKGPAKKLAFDAEGNPTPAAAGFARSKGVDVAALEVREIDGVEYLYAVKTQDASDTAAILLELLGELITALDWKRSQRWGSGDERFARPVRWLVALFGTDIIPVKFGHLEAGNVSEGYRFLDNRAAVITEPAAYVETLANKYVVVSQEARKETILEGVAASAKPYGKPLINEDVLEEVINLTERPSVLVGVFDEDFLRVPREILEYAMSKHQRYFAIERADGTLDNHFLVVSNGDEEFNAQIIEGHERVVRARLADAAFFYDEDRKVPLEKWLTKLEHVVFQEKLGTTAQKVERIEELSAFIADGCQVSPEDKAFALRAAHLTKADLVTNAVVEFTEVQGIMGGYYALAQGEAPEVACAITQHYRPRFSADAIPDTVPGQIVAVADKVDTICGIFAAGKAPKGTSDPFALRRSAIGVLQIALKGITLDLDKLIAYALDNLSALEFDRASVESDVKAFFIARLDSMLKDQGISTEVITAILAVSNSNPRDILERCEALQTFYARGGEVESLSAAYKRAKNLSEPRVGTSYDEALLEDVEKAFVDALSQARVDIEAALSAGQYDEALTRYAKLKEPVDAFFDGVMIMADDDNVRTNRLALLNIFVGLFTEFADFSTLA